MTADDSEEVVAISGVAARISELENKLTKLRRREARNLRHAKAEGFLIGVTALLRPGDIVLDCGANLGEIAAPLAATGAEVIAFEPDPYCFAALQDRFTGTPNVSLRQQAVAAKAGKVRLMRAANFDADPKSGSVKSTILPGGRGIDEAGGMEIEAIDFVAWLRKLIAERGEIAFVKMDIEGAELDLLEAMDEAELFGAIRCTVAETHENKFKELRPRYRALRERFAQKYTPRQVNLDWI